MTDAQEEWAGTPPLIGVLPGPPPPTLSSSQALAKQLEPQMREQELGAPAGATLTPLLAPAWLASPTGGPPPSPHLSAPFTSLLPDTPRPPAPLPAPVLATRPPVCVPTSASHRLAPAAVPGEESVALLREREKQVAPAAPPELDSVTLVQASAPPASARWPPAPASRPPAPARRPPAPAC